MKIHLGEINAWVLSGTGIEALDNRVIQLVSGQYTPDLDHVPVMDGYTALATASGIGATISASAEISAFWRSWFAFRDGQPALQLGWIGDVVNSGWLRSTFTAAITINKVTIQAINDGNYVRSPIDFTIRGSNDGFIADDNVLLTVTGEPPWSQNEKRTYTFPNYTEYAAYEIRITDSDGLEPGIGEVEMMFLFATGSPVAEAPTLTVDGVLDAANPLVIDEETSAGGDLKYQYKIDGGAYNGVWLTLTTANAALAALAGIVISTLQIKVQFNSDGTGKARLHNSPTYTEAIPTLTTIKGPIKLLKLDDGIKVIKI